MARIRSIKLDLFMDDGLADVSLEAHFLLAGLPCLADSEGRLEDRPRRIQAQIFPYRPVDVNAALDELARTGHVHRYEVNGQRFLQVSDWDRDQRPHVKEGVSLIPSPADSTEHRNGSGAAGNSSGTRRDKSAGILGVGSGVLGVGSGALPPPSSAAPRADLRLELQAAPRQRRAPKPEKPTDPRHAPLIPLLVEACREVTGHPYRFNGGVDAKALKELLAGADQNLDTRGDAAPSEVLRRWRIGLAWRWQNGEAPVQDLPSLQRRWNSCASTATAPPARVSTGPTMSDFSSVLGKDLYGDGRT